jgi:hypothetical protein
MRNLSAAFYANDIYYLDLPSETFCEPEVNFRTEVSPTPESLKWYIDGVEETSAQNLPEWSKTLALGEHEIIMYVQFSECETKSVSSTLKIASCEAAFYANNVHCDTLFKVTFCDKNVYFRAEVEGEWESIKWFFGGIEDEAGQNLLQWSKTFEPGEHLNIPVKVEVLFANNETVIIEGTLNVRAFWTKIKNIRH